MNVVAVIFSCPEHFNQEWFQFSLLSAPDHTPPSILKYMACGEMTRFKILFPSALQYIYPSRAPP